MNTDQLRLTKRKDLEMARNSNSETLVPVESVIAVTGFAPVWVWARVDERDVELDWDGSPAVHWSVAKRLADDARQAVKENAELNRRMREEQEAQVQREREELQREAVERAKSNPRLLRGVELSTPGDDRRPDWLGE
jgi:hypothetical protein